MHEVTDRTLSARCGTALIVMREEVGQGAPELNREQKLGSFCNIQRQRDYDRHRFSPLLL
jgi:hypothetical protein